jgi:hypothetical protein
LHFAKGGMRIVQCFVVKVERAAAGACLSPTLGKNPLRVGTPPNSYTIRS